MSSLKLSYERVRVTQGLSCMPPGVALDKTPSTSKWKFTIGCLTSSILNSSSLTLTELQKSLTSIDSFKKDVSFWSKPRWNNAGEDQQLSQVHREATLKQIPYIRYPTTFQEKSVSALLDSGSVINAIHPTFAKELGLRSLGCLSTLEHKKSTVLQWIPMEW